MNKFFLAIYQYPITSKIIFLQKPYRQMHFLFLVIDIALLNCFDDFILTSTYYNLYFIALKPSAFDQSTKKLISEKGHKIQWSTCRRPLLFVKTRFQQKVKYEWDNYLEMETALTGSFQHIFVFLICFKIYIS